MRFLLLSIMISSVALNGCGKTKVAEGKSNSGESENTLAQSRSNTHIAMDESQLSSEAIAQFQYIPTSRLQAVEQGVLKNRLDQGMLVKLKQLAHSHEELVFSDGVVVENSASKMSSSDFSVVAGNFWLIGANGDAVYSGKIEPGIDVWSLSGQSASAKHLSRSAFTDYPSFALVESMYSISDASSKQLLVRRGLSARTISGDVHLFKPSLPGPKNPSMLFQWVNVDSLATQSNFKATESLVIDGQFIASRRKDDVLYVISRFWAWQYGLSLVSMDESSVVGPSLSDYMPSYGVAGKSRKSLSESCLSAGSEASASLLNITAIDMVSHKVIASQCVNGNINGVHVSDNNVYLGVERESVTGATETELHQFAFSQKSIVYKASGAIPGSLQWGGERGSFSELGKGLYVVSTRRDVDWNPTYNLYRVQAFAESLQFLAATQDGVALFGNSELREVHYLGNRAYLIAEDENSPTAVLDLVGEWGPKFIGYLPVKSYFSSPLNKGQWLAIGDSNVLSISDVVNQESISMGVEVRLLSFEQVEAPRLLGSIIFKGVGTSSEVAYDLKSMTVKHDVDGTIHLALPIAKYKESVVEESPLSWDSSGLYLIDVNLSDSASSVGAVGAMVVAESSGVEYESRYTSSRSIFMDGSVFYYFNGQVYGALQDAVDFVNGPF